MTVGELIEKLQAYPQTAEVLVHDPEYGGGAPITGVEFKASEDAVVIE